MTGLTDSGHVNFDVDLSTGMVRVSVRPPLGLETSRTAATIPILDFLDIAARALLGLNAAQRQLLAKMAAGAPTGGTKPQ